jgi:hypothetical protein
VHGEEVVTSPSARIDHLQRKRQLERLDDGAASLFIATLEGVKTPEQILLEKEQSQQIERLIDRLPPRCGLAMRMRYGIQCEPMTLEQVAERFGVTRERIRQITAKGERLIRRWVLLEENPRRLREAEKREAEEQRAKNRANDERWRREVEARQGEAEAAQAAYEAANRGHLDEQRRPRNAAFAKQAKDLNAARDAYFEHLNQPDEMKYYLIYVAQMNDWGPRLNRIWRLFPHG